MSDRGSSYRPTALIFYSPLKKGWVWSISIGYGVFIERSNKTYIWPAAAERAMKNIAQKLNLDIKILSIRE